MPKFIIFSILAFCCLSLALARPSQLSKRETQHVVRPDTRILCYHQSFTGADAIRAAERAKILIGNPDSITPTWLSNIGCGYPASNAISKSRTGIHMPPFYSYPILNDVTYPEFPASIDMVIIDKYFNVVDVLTILPDSKWEYCTLNPAF
ncbi:hypothetical protein K3495_g14414 [Podosphaera aphanis]|nr:hypothetical protein K3495_g14414 [Podosphaera aphanis]